jgi:HTH-type transcriptional regulator/antitoxin HipB
MVEDTASPLQGRSGQKIRTASELGALVKAQRKQQGLTQLDLAGLGGTGNRFLVELEAGKPSVQLQKVLDMLDLLGIDVLLKSR